MSVEESVREGVDVIDDEKASVGDVVADKIVLDTTTEKLGDFN